MQAACGPLHPWRTLTHDHWVLLPNMVAHAAHISTSVVGLRHGAHAPYHPWRMESGRTHASNRRCKAPNTRDGTTLWEAVLAREREADHVGVGSNTPPDSAYTRHLGTRARGTSSDTMSAWHCTTHNDIYPTP